MTETPEGGELQEYEVDDGQGGTYTAQLSKADAEAQGLTGEKKAEDGTKAHTTSETKAVTPENKARRGTQNK